MTLREFQKTPNLPMLPVVRRLSRIEQFSSTREKEKVWRQAGSYPEPLETQVAHETRPEAFASHTHEVRKSHLDARRVISLAELHIRPDYR